MGASSKLVQASTLLRPPSAASSDNQTGETPEGQLEGDVVRFNDASTFVRAAQLMVERGVLAVRTTSLPRTLDKFGFSVDVPDGAPVGCVGRVRTLRGLQVLIDVLQGREEIKRAWMAVKQRPRSDRRVRDRRKAQHRVRIGEVECVTQDISPSGMCLETDLRLTVGALVDGTVQVERSWVPFQAEVRWCKLKEPREVHGRLGIRFFMVGDAYQSLLTRPTGEQPVVSPVTGPRASPSLRPSPGHVSPPETPTPPSTPAVLGRPNAPALLPQRAPNTAAVRTPPSGNTPRASERRQQKRVRRRHKVALEGMTGFTVDISEDGLLVEMLKTLVPGSEVSGTIQVEEAALPFTGQVRWARAGNPHLGLLGRMGIHLREAPPALVALLQQG
jgi:hypothetical protein